MGGGQLGGGGRPDKETEVLEGMFGGYNAFGQD
jgi:hypothetical protein